MRIRGMVAGLWACAAWPVAAIAAEPQEKSDCDKGSDVVEFRIGSARLDADARQQLDAVAQWLRDGDHRTVTVEGYTDPSGSADVNQKLSEERAQAVESYLQNGGVDEDRVETYGRGEAIATGPSDAADARVVVVRRCEQPAASSAGSPAPTPPASATPAPAPQSTPPVE